jgi:nucleoside phosphorylase
VRVLIVDDDSEKLQRVASVVRASRNGVIEIDTAQNSAQAKRFLLQTQYDLMILDVALPPSADVGASPRTGVELLKTVVRGKRYKKPRSIIGLTAYQELIAEASPEFASDSWTLIHFDRGSEEWEAQIRRKIDYLNDVEENPPRLEFDSELCVITALYDPEFKAVLALPWKWSMTEIRGDATQYWEGSFIRDDQPKRVVAAFANRMGMTFAATLAMKMIYQFRPRYLAMVGIAAGIRGRCSLGDAIVPDLCWDWGAGKFKESEGVPVFEQAPEQLCIDSFLKTRLQNLSHESAVLEQIRSSWPGEPLNSILRVHVGPMASGAAVLADRDHSVMIQKQNRKVLGIDMEAYAIFAAADQSSLQRPTPLVIKGVVDFADPKKNDRHQAFAAYLSANLLMALMERF